MYDRPEFLYANGVGVRLILITTREIIREAFDWDRYQDRSILRDLLPDKYIEHNHEKFEVEYGTYQDYQKAFNNVVKNKIGMLIRREEYDKYLKQLKEDLKITNPDDIIWVQADNNFNDGFRYESLGIDSTISLHIYRGDRTYRSVAYPVPKDIKSRRVPQYYAFEFLKAHENDKAYEKAIYFYCVVNGFKKVVYNPQYRIERIEHLLDEVLFKYMRRNGSYMCGVRIYFSDDTSKCLFVRNIDDIKRSLPIDKIRIISNCDIIVDCRVPVVAGQSMYVYHSGYSGCEGHLIFSFKYTNFDSFLVRMEKLFRGRCTFEITDVKPT